VPVPEDVELSFPQDGGCFGCSPSRDDGLRMRFRRRGERVHSQYTLSDRFHGAPQTAHGGIVATMLDEISCVAVVFVHDRYVVTGELTVRYERPCPTETPLELVAEVRDRSHAKYWIVEAELHAGGERLARSTGRFFLRDHEPIAP
jgi:acyl-coenzyme A thioesterase PaaI-like protein